MVIRGHWVRGTTNIIARVPQMNNLSRKVMKLIPGFLVWIRNDPSAAAEDNGGPTRLMNN